MVNISTYRLVSEASLMGMGCDLDGQHPALLDFFASHSEEGPIQRNCDGKPRGGGDAVVLVPTGIMWAVCGNQARGRLQGDGRRPARGKP
jgi:hypothetical protein